MIRNLVADVRNAFRDSGKVFYHVGLITLSAVIAVSLPFVAQGFLAHWARTKHEGVFLLLAEMAVAMLLIIFFNHLSRTRRYSRLARAASGAGLVHFFPVGGRLAERRMKGLIHRHGLGRNVMIIGSTGNTFVDPGGGNHEVLRDCLEAKIMLLNPCSQNAKIRAKSMLLPGVTLESLKGQAKRSVEFLKALKAAQKSIKLKLYSEDPNVKLAILGDHIWLQHYHSSLDVQAMPVYAFRHNPKAHGLYTVFYQYFMKMWERSDIPEYDFETDELVYRRSNGIEERREKLLWDVGPPSNDAPRSAPTGAHAVGE